MAISKEKKRQIVADLEEKLSRSQALIMTDYRGLKVSELMSLRNRLEEESCGYHVVKNRMVKLAIERAGLPYHPPLFDGPTAIGFCYGNPVEPAKILFDYAEKNKLLSIRGGMIGYQICEAKDIEALVTLPSREALVAQMMGLLRAPLANLVHVLSAPLRELAYILEARRKQLEA